MYHVRQTQRFCTGSLQYDPMITTFPGVYVVGVIWSQALRLISWAPALLYSTPPLPKVPASHCKTMPLVAQEQHCCHQCTCTTRLSFPTA